MKTEDLYENSGELLVECGNTALMAKIGRCLLHAFEIIGKELDRVDHIEFRGPVVNKIPYKDPQFCVILESYMKKQDFPLPDWISKIP